jgi:hypothetical protein
VSPCVPCFFTFSIISSINWKPSYGDTSQNCTSRSMWTIFFLFFSLSSNFDYIKTKMKSTILSLVCALFSFQDRVLLCSLGWPGTHQEVCLSVPSFPTGHDNLLECPMLTLKPLLAYSALVQTPVGLPGWAQLWWSLPAWGATRFSPRGDPVILTLHQVSMYDQSSVPKCSARLFLDKIHFFLFIFWYCLLPWLYSMC